MGERDSRLELAATMRGRVVLDAREVVTPAATEQAELNLIVHGRRASSRA